MCGRTSGRVRVTRRCGCSLLVRQSLIVLVLVMAVGALSSTPASAVTLFSETFDNASGFPGGLDPRKYGVPAPPDADESGWNAARFENLFVDPRLDVGLQEIGGGGNSTPVGIVEDDAGLYFEISTIGLTDVVLEFDWRTFSAFGGDRLRVGYLVDSSPVLDPTTGAADFRSGSQAWSNWTQLLEGKNDVFQHESFALPSGAANIIVGFWLDNGESDYGKFDNVIVTAVPEPSTALLVAAGMALMARRRR